MSYKYTRGGQYRSRNQEEIDKLTNEYTQREFEYDAAKDEAYRDYANMMAASGQKAMTDTMGKAAAMTGGYGNSYAATAGQSVYNDYMEQVAGAQTEFEDRAYARFANENARLMDKIGALENQESRDKAAWEEAYLNDLNAATMKGDTAALAQIYGMTEEEYIDKYTGNKPLTDEIIEGYKTAAKNGYAQQYADYLSGNGYDTSELAILQEGWNYMGDNDGTFTYENGVLGFTPNAKYKVSEAVNNAVKAPSSLKTGANFQIARVKGEGAHSSSDYGKDGDNWNVQLGEKVTEGEVYDAIKGQTGVVLYGGELYYVGGGSVFKIASRGNREDEYNNLLKYMKSIS